MFARHVHARRLAPVALGVCMLFCAAGVGAQMAGEVEFARGVGFAQTPGQAPRTLGKGLELKEGDRLTTADGASAIIKMQDGTRMTVRPNSEIVLQQYQFKENAPDNSMLMQLVRGGFRAVTGLISKSSPNAARVQTNTATIGIRGTDFDARVCAKDCGAESAKVADTSRPNAVQASAKVVSAQGDVNAVDGAGQRRRVAGELVARAVRGEHDRAIADVVDAHQRRAAQGLRGGGRRGGRLHRHEVDSNLAARPAALGLSG